MVINYFSVLILFLFVAENPNRIEWQEGEKLAWEHFLGKPDSRSSFAALTHSSVEFSYNVRNENGKLTLTTRVNTYFDKEMSWFKSKEVNDHILKHEQAHFDISEIHTRKLREAFAGYRVTKNFENDLSAFFSKINFEREKMQKQFDKETDHSRNFDKERQWQDFIAEELKRLEKWK
ncbi:MAG: hypothetical protein WDZ45_06290 [Flavobacteriaceae bacterium]